MGWGGVVPRTNRIQYQLHHAFDIAGNLRIPEPQNPKPLLFQPLIPFDIAFATMPTAINLDHQTLSQISEIRNERPDGRLPPKIQPQHPVQLAQLRPDLPLLRRHLRPQFLRALSGDGMNSSHALHTMPEAPHPNPPHKGEGAPNRPPPVPTPTEEAPPLPLVGREWEFVTATTASTPNFSTSSLEVFMDFMQNCGHGHAAQSSQPTRLMCNPSTSRRTELSHGQSASLYDCRLR